MAVPARKRRDQRKGEWVQCLTMTKNLPGHKSGWQYKQNNLYKMIKVWKNLASTELGTVLHDETFYLLNPVKDLRGIFTAQSSIH